MKKELESRWEKKIDDIFRSNEEKIKFTLEKKWRQHLAYFWEYFANNIKKDNSKTLLLDVGCGAGFISKELAKSGFKVYGVDFSLEAIKFAQSQNPKINFQRSSIYELPFPDEMFNIIICLGVFQTVTNSEKALDEMARVLKREGVLIIRTLNTLSLVSFSKKKKNPFYTFYNPFLFKKEMKKRGFKVCFPRGVYFFPGRLNSLSYLIVKTKLYKIFNFFFFPIFMLFTHNFYIEGIKR